MAESEGARFATCGLALALGPAQHVPSLPKHDNSRLTANFGAKHIVASHKFAVLDIYLARIVYTNKETLGDRLATRREILELR
jgi:hypothetical protein